MRRLSGVLFAIAAVLVLVAVGCGGDGSEKGAQEYFEEIAEIFAKHEADVQTAQATYDAVVASDLGEEKEVKAYLILLETSSKSIRAETADREKIEPPPKIEEAHLDLLAAARVIAKIYEDAQEGASDAKTAAELQQALHAIDFGTRLEEAQGRADEACTKLQALAGEEGIEDKVC